MDAEGVKAGAYKASCGGAFRLLYVYTYDLETTDREVCEKNPKIIILSSLPLRQAVEACD